MDPRLHGGRKRDRGKKDREEDFLVFFSPSRRGGIAKTEKEEKEYKKKIEKE
jgi:hypothetical protein